MASPGTGGGDLAIRAVLGLIIVALAAVLLYVTIVPAQRIAREEAQTEFTRERMSDIRTALTAFRDLTNTYPATLDSVALFARTDSTFQARIAAAEERFRPLQVDSLMFSPRSGTRFLYEVVRDTTGGEIYWLGDPDVPGDSIGSREPVLTLRNAASWE